MINRMMLLAVAVGTIVAANRTNAGQHDAGEETMAYWQRVNAQMCDVWRKQPQSLADWLNNGFSQLGYFGERFHIVSVTDIGPLSGSVPVGHVVCRGVAHNAVGRAMPFGFETNAHNPMPTFFPLH